MPRARAGHRHHGRPDAQPGRLRGHPPDHGRAAGPDHRAEQPRVGPRVRDHLQGHRGRRGDGAGQACGSARAGFRRGPSDLPRQGHGGRQGGDEADVGQPPAAVGTWPARTIPGRHPIPRRGPPRDGSAGRDRHLDRRSARASGHPCRPARGLPRADSRRPAHEPRLHRRARALARRDRGCPGQGGRARGGPAAGNGVPRSRREPPSGGWQRARLAPARPDHRRSLPVDHGAVQIARQDLWTRHRGGAAHRHGTGRCGGPARAAPHRRLDHRPGRELVDRLRHAQGGDRPRCAAAEVLPLVRVGPRLLELAGAAVGCERASPVRGGGP